MPPKVKNLVVDTTAFLNKAQLHDLGENIYTTPEIVEEVKCKRQLRRLVVLPYDLKVKEPDSECVTFITNFAKKTGDFLYLSPADIKILALTYHLEKELIGTDHLKNEPEIRTVGSYDSKEHVHTPGFYFPENSTVVIKEDAEDENVDDFCVVEHSNAEVDGKDSDENVQEVPDVQYHDDNAIIKQFSLLSCNKGIEENQVINPNEDGDSDNNNDEIDPCVTDSDNAGWITPSNFRHVQSLVDFDSGDTEIQTPMVGCITSDFSIQNVLKQIGLNIISMNGLVIKEIRTFILRCYACFHISPQTTRIFCPKCGNKTLKRVSVTVDSDGKQQIHINYRRPLTARGKKFPLPRPKGGKHAVNPILCEDQRVPQQRLSKLALAKNNPLDPDYIAGQSPFLMRDVSSKSAVINASVKSEVKYWMRKNPNEVAKKKRKK